MVELLVCMCDVSLSSFSLEEAFKFTSEVLKRDGIFIDLDSIDRSQMARAIKEGSPLPHSEYQDFNVEGNYWSIDIVNNLTSAVTCS